MLIFPQCYTFGRNNHGQLGLAGVKETRSPRVVSGLSSGASRGAGGVGRHVIKVIFMPGIHKVSLFSDRCVLRC